MDDYDAPPEIETSLRCPACDSLLYLTYQSVDVPYEGIMNINTYYCKKCYYKNTSIESQESVNRKRITFKLERPEDLLVMVYRSPRGTIIIPEIGAEVYPGDHSNGEITTVEGIIASIRDMVESFMESGEDRFRAEESKHILDLVMDDVRENATIIIDDPSGKSVIDSPRAVTEIK